MAYILKLCGANCPRCNKRRSKGDCQEIFCRVCCNEICYAYIRTGKERISEWHKEKEARNANRI